MPPHKLRALQASITDKTSEPYQRLTWEALKKSLNGLVNKVNCVSDFFSVILAVRKCIFELSKCKAVKWIMVEGI